MNTAAALQHLAAYREGRDPDARMVKALRLVDSDAEAKGQLAEQMAFDAQLQTILAAIPVPEDLRQRLDRAHTGAEPARRSRQATNAVVSVVLGVVVILGLLVFFHIENAQKFPGSEALAKLALTPNNMSGFEMDPVSKPASGLGDWFYMRGFEGFQVPPELRTAPVVGARLFKNEGRMVAQVATEAHHSLVYVLRAEEFGVQLPENGAWRVFESQEWVAAARVYQGLCAMVTFRGSEAEMHDFLQTLPKP